MHSYRTTIFARILMFLLLGQFTLVAVALPVGNMPASADTAHDCSGLMMAMGDSAGDIHDGMHHDSQQTEHEHSDCIDDGCFDCVGSVAFGATGGAVSPDVVPNRHAVIASLNRLVFSEPDLPFRPPILH